MLAQVADYPPGSTYGPRVLYDYEFIWMLSGSAVWTVQQLDPSGEVASAEEQHLRPGQLVLARRGIRDHHRWDPNQPSRHAYLHFQIHDHGTLPPEEEWPTMRRLTGSPILEGLCGYLLELGGDPSEGASQRSGEIVTLLLDVFVRGPLPADRPRLPGQILSTVEHVRRIWADDGMRIVPVGELAGATHLSVGHLHRLFRGEFGLGPSRVFELIRLARGAVALQRSNSALAQIADLTGYSNPYHFSRRFSEVYGCPPGTFRSTRAGSDPLEPLKAAGLLEVAHPLLTAS